jgi:hypothetical protein
LVFRSRGSNLLGELGGGAKVVYKLFPIFSVPYHDLSQPRNEG